jgi:hypothetical protein
MNPKNPLVRSTRFAESGMPPVSRSGMERSIAVTELSRIAS